MAVEFVAQDATLELLSEPHGRIIVEGQRNVLRVGRNVTLNIDIVIQGSGCLVEIEDDCQLAGLIHIVRGEGSIVRIGQTTTFNAVGLTLHEAGEIMIGKDCLFSTDIHMDVSDMHPIYDGFTCERINPAKSIHIGDHVWVGRRSVILKGARIGSGSVIGAGALVSGEIPSHVVAAGSPATIMRRDIIWSRNFGDVVSPLPRPAPPPQQVQIVPAPAPASTQPSLARRAVARARRTLKAALGR